MEVDIVYIYTYYAQKKTTHAIYYTKTQIYSLGSARHIGHFGGPVTHSN